MCACNVRKRSGFRQMKCRIARQMIRSRFVLGLAAAASIGTGAASTQLSEWKFVPVHVSPCAYIPAYCKRLELSENENCRTKSSDPGATCTLTVNATKRFTPHQCESVLRTSETAPGEGAREPKPASFVLPFLKDFPEEFKIGVGLDLPSRAAIRVKSFSSGLVAKGCDGPENSIHARMIKAAGDCDSDNDLTALTATPQSSGSGAIEIEGLVDADLPWTIKLTPKGQCSLEVADTTASGKPPGEITVQIELIPVKKKKTQTPQPVLSEVQLENCGPKSPACPPTTDSFAKLKSCLDEHRQECLENGFVTFDVKTTPKTSARYRYHPNCDDSRSRLYGYIIPFTDLVEKDLKLWLDFPTFRESFEIISFSPELTAVNCQPGDLVFYLLDHYHCPPFEYNAHKKLEPADKSVESAHAHVDNKQLISLRGDDPTKPLPASGALYLLSHSDTCSIRSPSNENFYTLLLRGRLNITKLYVDPTKDAEEEDDPTDDSDNGHANKSPGAHQGGAKPPPVIPLEKVPGGGNAEEGKSGVEDPDDGTLELETPHAPDEPITSGGNAEEGKSGVVNPDDGSLQPENPSSAAAAPAAAIPTFGGAALGSGAATLGIALAISLHNIL